VARVGEEGQAAAEDSAGDLDREDGRGDDEGGPEGFPMLLVGIPQELDLPALINITLISIQLIKRKRLSL
jgi:hypothetical protein